MKQRLYRVEIIDYPFGSIPDDEFPEWHDEDWKPDGWLADDNDRQNWIARHGDDRFFWPSTSKVYRSRSSATRLATLIESYGATAIVLEAEPSWESIEDANARRARARRAKTIAALRARIETLEAS